MLLEIAPVTDAGLLPACTPSLMPFCISYSGPAPVSRYFRPRPAPPSLAALSLQSSSSATLVASSSSLLSKEKSSLGAVSSATSIGSLAHESECGEDELLSMTRSSVVNQVEQVTATGLVMDAATGMDSETQPALDVVPPDDSSKGTGAYIPASRNVGRLVAAFRGRQMYGQVVDIPNGYGGLVLRAPLDPKGNLKGKDDANKVSKTRGATRRLNHATVDDPKEKDDGDRCPDSDVDPLPPARKLVPLSTFNSFMLWTPDRPLDEGRDEYVKALAEWTRLAAEIHSYDE
ncbi:ribonuclease H2, subunit C [Boletus edulis]|nr:ribonuclease H2, subunit C [Boletus edulis]